MKVLLIEDEPAAARKLKRLLESNPHIGEVVDIIDSVETGKEWFASNDLPDLVISDVELADGLCFSIFDGLKFCPPIIFVTAYDQYALQAFRTEGVDYLLKPVVEKDLEDAIQKLQRLQRSPEKQKASLSALQEAYPADSSGNIRKRFLIRIGSKLVALDISEAAYFFVENRIVFYQSKTAKRYPLDLSLDELEGMLDPSRFFRINRQFIIGVEAIKEMQVVSKSRVRLLLEPGFHEPTIVSKERSPVFRQWIQGISGQG